MQLPAISTKTETSSFCLENFAKGEEYSRRYKVFHEKCPQMKCLLKLFSVHLPSAMKHISTQEDVLNVLSAGAGNGEMDQEIVKIIKNVSKKKVYNRGIEPNEFFVAKYKESIDQLSSELSGNQVIFDITKPQSFQSYMSEKKNDPVKFHVVHFVHSIYFMQDFEEALTHCYKKELGENGIIVCILTANAIVCETKKKLFNLDQTADSIIDIIKKHGWKYEHHISEYCVDVTEVFDDQSEKGNLLLDFLTNTMNFRATMDDQIVQDMLHIIKTFAETINGKQMSKKVDDFILIFK